MKKLFFFIFLSITCFTSFAQNKKTDSLLTLLKTDKQDTNKVIHLNALGWMFKQSSPDTAIILGNQALFLAEKQQWKNGIATSLSQLGVYNSIKGNYPKALDYYFKTLKVKEEIGNKNSIAATLGNIGIVYRNQVDYPKALDYYFKALKMAEELGNKNLIAIHLG